MTKAGKQYCWTGASYTVRGNMAFELASAAECTTFEGKDVQGKLKAEIATLAGNSVSAGQVATAPKCSRRLSDERMLAARSKASLSYTISGMTKSGATAVTSTLSKTTRAA